MKHLSLLSLALCITVLGFSQTTIKLEDVSKHVGDSVTVCGKVAGGIYLEQLEGSPTFLNLGAPYPDQLLSISISNDLRGKYEKAPEEMFQDKDVCVTDKIVVVREMRQIAITKKEQLTTK